MSDRAVRIWRPWLLGPAAVIAAFVGVLAGHTLEYLRSGGTRGALPTLFGSIHAYMLPLVLALAVLSALAGASLWRAWTTLGRRLREAGQALAIAWRSPVSATLREGSRTAARSAAWPAAMPSTWRIWPALAAVQLSLYLLQENVERAVAGMPLPGLMPLTGAHAPAILIHLALALVSATALAWAARRLEGVSKAIEACERLRHLVLERRSAHAGVEAGISASPDLPPLARFGRQLWRRPPPRLLSITPA